MLDALQRLQAERKVAIVIFAVLAALSLLRFHFIDPADQTFSVETHSDGKAITMTAPRVVEVGL